jgi:hypothetical protein
MLVQVKCRGPFMQSEEGGRFHELDTVTLLYHVDLVATSSRWGRLARFTLPSLTE